MRKKVIGLLLLVSTLIGVAAWLYFTDRLTTVYQSVDYSVALTTSSAVKVVFTEETRREMENTVDVIRTFDVTTLGISTGTYSIVERTLGNKATFLFERTENDGLLKLNVATNLTFNRGVDLAAKSWNPEVVAHPHHGVFGKDPTVNPFGRITAQFEDNALQIIAGNAYISEALVKSYERGKESRIRVLAEEIRNVGIENDSISNAFELEPGEIAESWLLISEEPLFTTDEEEDEYIDFALNHQESQLNWLTKDGPFTKLPFSIEPSSEMGYGRVIGRIEDDVALAWHAKSASVFFETMVLNSRVNLLYYIDEFEGTRWPTEYTSTWLGNAYGVRAPYVDTRYNEYVAFFLDETARTFPDEVEDAAFYVPVYADYLLSRVEANEIIKAGDGYLIVDYFDEDPETPVTHASLNHELGGLKILLTAFRDTNEQKYLDVAMAVMSGIESFGQSDGGWIRDSGDLWYQARPDGTFSGDDYPQLTLVDLLETQRLLEEMDFPRNVYFDEMIESKLAYLASEGTQLIEKVVVLMGATEKSS